MDEAQMTPAQQRMAKARAQAAANRAARKAASGPQPDPSISIDNEIDAPQPSRAANRTPAHEPIRTVNGRSQVRGRNGEVLSRKRTHAGDIFAIPAELIPPDYEYQWCAVSVTGNTEVLLDQNLMFAENGWRAVPADRYPGRFMPVGHKGSIIRGGQMLMERPKILCDEARAEDTRNAKQLISDSNESLKLASMKKELGSGFEMGGKYRGTRGDIRMSIDKALDAPAAKYDLADPE